MFDILEEIIATTRRNKLRTALTGFAVAWGIFMLIFLLGAGNGLINASVQNSGDFLDRSMVVYEGFTSKPYKGLQEGRPINLKDGDLTTTRDKFSSNVDQLAAKTYVGSQQISLADNYFSTTVEGVYPVEQVINKQKMLCGRFINNTDLHEQRKVIVLSENQAKELVKHPQSLVGKYVKLGNFTYLVVGITQSAQNGFNENALVPFTTLRTIYNKGDDIDRIYFTFRGLDTEKENDEFVGNYRAAINKNHQAAPDDDRAIWIRNRFTQAMQMDKGTSIIRTALWIIGIFTLLSGIVGVSNIMLITVRERTHEFGIRKAIGAKPWSILKLIIVESIIITTFFGYLGMLAGMAANQYMDATAGKQVIDAGPFKVFMFVDPTVGFDVCLEATIVMVIAGTCAGLIPAMKAAHIRPIEALREE
jgi:putative ABC transport system permease protein